MVLASSTPHAQPTVPDDALSPPVVTQPQDGADQGGRLDLRPRPGGAGWDYGADGWSAFVAPDGTVTFSDRRLSTSPGGLVETTRQGDFVAEDAVPTPATDPPLPVYPGGNAGRPSDVPGVALERMGIPDPPSNRRWPLQPSIAGARARFDLTDEILRGLGEDPYAAQKAAFLNDTFEWRIQLARQARAGNTRQALVDLPELLEQVWSQNRPAYERRAVLFALWAEASDTPDGRRAQRTIEAFINRRLPAGSPDAFTDREQRQYGFRPYGS